MNDIENTDTSTQPVANKAVPEQPLPKRHRARNIVIIVCITIVSVVMFLGLSFMGVTSFAYGLVKCGKLPITGTEFMGSYRYYRPSDNDYGPRIFAYRTFCSEDEAVASGYRGLEGSLTYIRENAELTKQAEAARFSREKVKYVALYPTYLPAGYVLEQPNLAGDTYDNVSQFAKKNDVYSIWLEQYTLKASEELCSLGGCTVVGTSSSGNTIYYSHSENNGISSWGMKMSDSIYVLYTLQGYDLTLAEATKVLSSLEPLK